MKSPIEPGLSHLATRPTRGAGGSVPATLRISETFQSRQGEGKLTGVESFFIRTSGCNLRCHFCDTPYASWNPTGTRQSIDQLVTAAVDSGVKHVVLTGGEPLLPVQSPELCRQLRQGGLHVTIETAGTIDRAVVCDLASISPKLSSSTPSMAQHPRWAELHQQRRMTIPVMRKLIDQSVDYQIKFVVTSKDDFAEIQSIASGLDVPPDSVWIMPEGVTVQAIDLAASWLRPLCRGSGYHYCDRMQIRWYGNRRGT